MGTSSTKRSSVRFLEDALVQENSSYVCHCSERDGRRFVRGRIRVLILIKYPDETLKPSNPSNKTIEV